MFGARQLNKLRPDSPLRHLPTPLTIPSSDEISPPVAMGCTASREPDTPPSRSPVPLQLSIKTLLASDFNSRPVPRINCPGDGGDVNEYKTPLREALPLPGTWTVGKEESLRALNNHMNSRAPFVMEASEVYQKAVGVRNADEFLTPYQPDISGVVKLVASNPALRHLREDMGGLGTTDRGHPKQAEIGPPMTDRDVENSGPATAVEMRDGGKKEKRDPKWEQRRVNLRESLLWHGRQPYGRQKRVEIATISFHDLTPSTRTGNFSNELIAHFSADSGGKTRIVGYEMDILAPQPHHNEANPPITERWISFLISTPILTVNSAYYSPFEPDPLPPNLPHPIPTSWVMFAAPLACVDAYPPQRDTILASTRTSGPTSNCSVQSQLCDVKRLDFDFSLNGVPVFEFMNKSKVLGELGTQLQKGIRGEFLCAAKDLVGWKEVNSDGGKGNEIADLPRRSSFAKLATPRSKRTAADMDVDDEMAPGEPYPSTEDIIAPPTASPDTEMGGQDLDKEAGMAAEKEPFNMDVSQWWTQARVNFWKDSCRWERIKAAMGRGCCRVIVTLADSPGPGPGPGLGSGPSSGSSLRPSFGPGPPLERERRFPFGEEESYHPGRERSSGRDFGGLSCLRNRELPPTAAMMMDVYERHEGGDDSGGESDRDEAMLLD